MKGLKEGKQTQITALVKKEAKKIKGTKLNYLINVLKYIKINYQFLRESEKKYPKRIRAADELIKSKIMTECTDFAHLCLVLLRAKNSCFVRRNISQRLVEKTKQTHTRTHFCRSENRKRKIHFRPNSRRY
jgi:hypothetical protein